ncbi:hypothetical protein OPV22_020577 [Ensete ventricosum]|uniref:Uncharacterized protein n=1 Tax=Ensete ventricosum TaxID=4639 RepID=A0AAV8QGS1_ENSVE|nr:hypothetical protein OPV22_020577 [Ensete ventricosum]
MRSQVPQLVATVGVKEEEANVEEEPSVDKAKEEEEVEEEGRPAEELNRRVEDFIAKVTMQRKEARSQHAHVLSAKSGGLVSNVEAEPIVGPPGRAPLGDVLLRRGRRVSKSRARMRVQFRWRRRWFGPNRPTNRSGPLVCMGPDDDDTAF